MKMVAASKLRRAQEQAHAAQPYAQRMQGMLSRLAANYVVTPAAPRLLVGSGKDQTHLLIVLTSDRGLAGGFNSYVVREARRQIAALLAEGKTVKVLTVGRKARDLLRRDHRERIIDSLEGIGRKKLSFTDATVIAKAALDKFDAGEVDVVTVIYNRFKSVMAQIPTQLQLVPFQLPKAKPVAADPHAHHGHHEHVVPPAVYEFEPSEEEILAELLPRNLAIQLYSALLDSAAGEQAARMTAMDNATRNAGDAINRYTLAYNRARQAAITKELIEIVSGAEAL
ncbi:ATP synthase gamma chain [Rhodospirillales bacterium TMPK1]|uniref:ATP synthase gamma chain n=2 Tax=Roseiterribacter gracilis TaxID=2812848 RepID=A0A8S8XJ72_9PROT|nr:ATP synthase gamma chain [Rhodospirillales bacterium TMPK1]